MSIFSACTSILGFVMNSWHLLSGGVALAVIIAFFFSFFRQYAATRAFVRSFRIAGVFPEALRNALRGLGMNESAVRVVDSKSLLCFCAGFLSPRIFISRGALQALSGEELLAVIIHERRHQRKRDPLRSALLRGFKHALFFIPIVHYLEKRHAIAKEVAADAEAVAARAHGKIVLASALYKLSGTQELALPALSLFADWKVLEIRISFLAGRGFIPVTLTPKAFGASLVVIAAFLLLAVHPSRAEAPPQESCNISDPGWAILRSAPTHKTEGGYAR